ncbi:MAG: hypothetical protein SFT81_06925 [Candidatus Caenarcaniphilales bacterium]|nr:hypothetical protein [Candidatus Caenarcaniphilales bacterium]
MKTEKDYLNLVGRYERQREGTAYRDEEDDLHVIAVDFEEKKVLMDFSASPDWYAIDIHADGLFIVEGKFRLNPASMRYELIE